MKGWPDYVRTTGLVENYDEYAQNYPVGVGDGAARLGSIKTYDMRGRAWWMDNFEAAVLHWQTRNLGVGGSQALTTDTARNGNQSVKLISNTGAARRSQILRYFPRPKLEQIGVEVSLNTPASFGTVTIETLIYDGSDKTYLGIRAIEATEIIEYRSYTGAWVDSGMTLDQFDETHLFNSFKYVFNYKLNTYVRLLHNHQEIDLTGTPLSVGGSWAHPTMMIRVDNVGDGINNSPIHVDDVILTVMEP